MPKPSQLFEQLGPRYVNEMLAGAMFNYKGVTHIFEHTNEDLVARTTQLSNNPEKPSPKSATVPPEFFTGWSAFSHPVLGYRMAAGGQVLAYYSRVNGTRRGLSAGSVSVDFLDVSHQCASDFGLNLHHYMEDYPKAIMLMQPSFLTFSDGFKKVSAGQIPAFAISPDFAVAPADDVDFLEVLFRQRRVGTVDENGNTTITVPSINYSWMNSIKEAK